MLYNGKKERSYKLWILGAHDVEMQVHSLQQKYRFARDVNNEEVLNEEQGIGEKIGENKPLHLPLSFACKYELL